MDSAALIVPAPAKLNLFLHVTGRRPDGYHTIESLMVLLDFGDTLTLTGRQDGQIVLARPIPGVPVESDLVFRAARLLQQHAGTAQGATIALDKRIPMGAGLGGGSSDAASVLLGLNRLWNLGLPRAELMRLGLELGADVPFFVFGFNAHVTGIGDILRPVTMPRLGYLILVPPVNVATAGIFASAQLKRDTPASGQEAFPLGYGRNDLQPVAAGLHLGIPAAIAALDRLDAGSSGVAPGALARMSGSGSSVFRIVDCRAAGFRSAPPAGGPDLIVARGLHRHPLREFAAK